MTSNAMKNLGFTPNEELAEFQAKANQRRKKVEHEKKKGITILNSNLLYIDNLRYNLIDNTYLITSKVTCFQRLSTIHVLLGHSMNVEQILDLLGYYSLNDFIRQNRQYFNEFLEIFVTKTAKKSTSTNSQLVLNYFNKKIHQHPLLKKSMKEALEEEAFEQGQQKRFRITFDETKYFEFHNSLEFIDGRKEFVKVVAECQRRMLINMNGYVPVNKFALIFKELFNDSYTSVRFLCSCFSGLY
uniref:Uncharacterized protein n=1 Tax=Panagrolaimus davidi TaxID=227884 RepID=A0A914QDF6_9BILA